MENKIYAMTLSGEETWRSFSDFRGLMKNHKFCDVEIIVQREIFKANSTILSKRSSYFEAIFDESSSKRIELEDNISPSSFRKILDYFYSGVLEVSADEIVELWNAAISLQIEYISQQCLNCAMANKLDGVFLEIFAIARRRNFTDLLKWLKSFSSRNINRISECPEFQKLSADELLQLIGKPSRSNAKRFSQVAFKWIVTKRQQDDDFNRIPDILNDLNLHFLNPEDIDFICNRESIADFMVEYPEFFKSPQFDDFARLIKIKIDQS